MYYTSVTMVTQQCTPRMKHHVYLEKDDDRRRVSSMYDIFEDLAVAVMNQAWLSDSEICRRAMISRWQRVRGYNYLDLAFHGHARNFMAHPACQEIISAGWRGWFRRDTGALRVWLIIFLPFLCVTPLVPFDKRVNYRRAVQGRYRVSCDIAHVLVPGVKYTDILTNNLPDDLHRQT